tara:strand:+ start:59 stop:280 length:222 start_codon:yes stop_codon:yes gene_type:complete
MPINEFYSYSVSDDSDSIWGKYSRVIVYDLDQNGYEIARTKSKKVAKYIMNMFDNLAIDEEQILFHDIIEEYK